MPEDTDGGADADPVIRARYSETEPASEAVVRALAAVEDVDPTELDTLYESIDLEALDGLLGEPTPGETPSIAVEFVALGYRTVVENDGRITVLDASGDG